MDRRPRPKTWVGIVLVLALTLWSAGPDPAGAQAPPGGAPPPAGGAQGPEDRAGTPTDFVPGEILVQFKPGAPGQAIAEAHRQNGGQPKDILRGIDVHLVAVPAGQETARVAAYQRHPAVAFAEVNGFVSAVYHEGDGNAAPNDSDIQKQWQYNNTGQNGGTPGADIDAFKAWDFTLPAGSGQFLGRGDPRVTIAIVDTGVKSNHEDLAGKVDLTRSANCIYTTNYRCELGRSEDDNGHGTHVAGLAGAATNNAKGVAGTCPNCTLIAVKVLPSNGTAPWVAVANGIVWAADHGAQAINLSLGVFYPSNTGRLAIDYAWNKGAVLACAAGNNNVSWNFYPASYPNCIAVAATDRTDAKASFSNYGSWVDVAAPGAAIWSTYHRDGEPYFEGNGTSMATPQVAGVAGLIWSRTGLCPDNTRVRNLISSTADKLGANERFWPEGRRLNAFQAVAAPSC